MLRSLALCSLFALAGCADLPAIESGTCGNRVVDSNEDCDTFSSRATAGDTQCGAPGNVNACRFVCGPLVSGAPSTPFCPDGYGCGNDGVCRAPSGSFQTPLDPVGSPAVRLAIADFDGDGAGDVLAIGNADSAGRSPARILYFDDNGANVAAFAVPALISSPTAGDVTDDGIADLAFAFASGIGLAQGEPDRTVAPIAYPNLTLPAAYALRFAPIYATDPDKGAQVTLFTEVFGLPQITRLQDGQNPVPLVNLEDGVANLAGDIAIGRVFDAISACDDIAYAFTGHQDVSVFAPCRQDSATAAWNDEAFPAVHITFGQPTDPTPPLVDRGVLLVDANGDKHLDVLIGAKGKTYVAYGDGYGAFFPQSDATKTLSGQMNHASLLAMPPTTSASNFPLAVADLDGDGEPDIVTSTGIWMTSLAKAPNVLAWGLAYVRPGDEWAGARIVDMNANGLADVVAYTKDALAIEFLNGNGAGFNLLAIPTNGAVSALTVGDFDGDLALDVAFSEAGQHTEDGVSVGLGDSVTVLFGNGGGYPDTLISLGRFARIQEIASARLASNPVLAPGNLSDMGVLSLTEDNSQLEVAILYGSSAREPIAPFGLNDPLSMLQTRVNAVGVGRFVQPSSPDRHGVWSFAAVSTDLTTTLDNRIWLVRAGADASVTTSVHTGPIALDPQVTGNYVPRILAGDMDRDGIDEAIVLAPTSSDTTISLVIAKSSGSDPATASFDILSQQPIDTGGKHWDVRVADIDGDGFPDLVLHRALKHDVSIFWNDGHGGFDLANPVVLSPSGEPFAGVSVVRSSTTPGRSVAIVTRESVFLARGTDASPRSLALAKVSEVGGTNLECGDVNGDGIEDLVIGDDSIGVNNVRVVLGAPVRK